MEKKIKKHRCNYKIRLKDLKYQCMTCGKVISGFKEYRTKTGSLDSDYQNEDLAERKGEMTF